jgi:predicted NAD/FAD-binding protein
MNSDIKNIGIIGSGVAGLTVAYLLQRKHNITLFEKNDYIGGHTHTIIIPDGPDAGIPVDTGFIVMNHKNYPFFTRLLEALGVELRDSVMSFGYHDEVTGLEYSSLHFNGLFAQRRNLFNPRFYSMLFEIMRFFREAPVALEEGKLAGLTLGDYFSRNNFSDYFIEHHILPMGCAIWSTPTNTMLDFPAESFIRFYKNHGLLSVGGQPQWRTVVGGSHSYVKKILNDFKGKVYNNKQITSVKRIEGGVTVLAQDGQQFNFDEVVIAAHADEAFTMLADPSTDERKFLSPWRYNRNDTILHTDFSAMPPNRRAWSSWNFVRESEGDNALSLTYHMNLLQGLSANQQYFVTLNRRKPIPRNKIIAEMLYTHPIYTADSMRAQKDLPSLNGKLNTWFCGSYFGYGFHEDAVRSAVAVARDFGIEL